MTVRAKFKVTHISPRSEEGSVSSITLAPVYGDSPENKDFFKWTPSGAITLGTINPTAAAAFELDKEYYVDFTRATITEPTPVPAPTTPAPAS